jgi:putative ABC transport system permease protein
MWQDLGHGLRMLGKDPGFTALAVLSFAIGTGANAAMFGLADTMVLRLLIVPRPGRPRHRVDPLVALRQD